MGKLLKKLNHFAGQYLNTRVVFLLDMIMSLAASLLALVFLNMFVEKDLLANISTAYWMGSSFIGSFFLIWFLRTYRIIIRHMSIRELARFALLAFTKDLFIGFVYGIALGFNIYLYTLLICDFFLTFGAFFFLRLAMLIAYDVVKGKMEIRKQCQNVLVY